MAQCLGELEEQAPGRSEAIDEELVQIEIPVELAEFLSSGGESENAGGVQRFCRVCLHAVGADMSCIFSGVNDDQIAFMLTAFTRLQLVVGDGMPSKVCTSCRELIIQCYTFKQKCERSDTALRAFFQGDVIYSVKSETEELNVKAEGESSSGPCIDNEIENSNDSINGGVNEVSSLEHSEIKLEIKVEVEEDNNPFCPDKHNGKSDNKRKCKRNGNNSTEHIHNCDKSEKVAKLAHKKRKLMCGKCDKSYNDVDKLSRHIETHLIEKAGKCEICSKNCKSERGLRRHVISAHRDESTGERPFQCPQCELSFLSKKDLMIHSAVHSDGLLTCYECRKVFTTLLQLKRHIKRHMEDKPHKCEMCFKTFSEVFALNRHQRSHFGTAVEKKHNCNICGKKFAEKSALTVHTRQHTGERPYVCSVCGKTFIQSSNLTLHMRVHSGERPYACSVCGNKFTSWSTMKSHERIHTGEKPYSCKICGQRFARMDMKAHMRRHTGERPYTCTLCDKSFFTSVRLAEHSRMHSGIKPFECSLCGLKLAAKSGLVKHMKKHRVGNINKISGMPKPKSYVVNVEYGQNDSTETSTLQICDYVDRTETVVDQSGEIKDEVSREEIIIPDLADGLAQSLEVEVSEAPAPTPPGSIVAPRVTKYVCYKM